MHVGGEFDPFYEHCFVVLQPRSSTFVVSVSFVVRVFRVAVYVHLSAATQFGCGAVVTDFGVMMDLGGCCVLEPFALHYQFRLTHFEDR